MVSTISSIAVDKSFHTVRSTLHGDVVKGYIIHGADISYN